MGDRFLVDLADVCRTTGYPVTEVDGWQTRARGSGGYDTGRPTHLMIHHTASGPSSDGWPDVNYCTFGDDDAPLCNLYLSRLGEIFICAAGATNTNGSGHDPCGVTGDDSMNSSAVGIEAGNDGVGEVWPASQLDAYLALVGALCDGYGIAAAQCHSHWEYAPTRKVDPAGPPRPTGGGPSPLSWNMDEFRLDLDHVPPPEPVPPEPGPVPPIPPSPGDDDMLRLYIIGYAGADTDGALYCTDLHTKVWLTDNNMATAKEAVIGLEGGDPAHRPIADRELFKAYGPVIGPRPEGADEWGLP